MILKQANFLQAKNKVNLWCATTCAIKDKEGRLVMGKGTALTMKQGWVGTDRAFGGLITSPLYGLVVLGRGTNMNREPYFYGAFQTKYHWRMDSDLELIKYSTMRLFEWLLGHPTYTVALPLPGCRNGNLNRDDVLPIMRLLPDNVTVYDYS